MKNIKRTPEDNQKAQLENELARLNKKIAKYEAIDLKQNRFGLVWLDVPEAFEDDVENKLPILKEVPKLAINSKDNKPTHLLIEGDNYHALTCLSYTHKGKVDVIYIDPPYNTGSDGFKYKDKRILKEYPDGTEVPVDHPLRHSYWLSFMRKRLELAEGLLSDRGVMFISIDDNELAQLKILCSEIFKNDSFIDVIIWKKSGFGRDGKMKNTTTFRKDHEYIIVCYKNKKTLNKIKEIPQFQNEYDNPDNDHRGAYKAGSISRREDASSPEHKNYYEITSPSGKKFKRQFDIPKEDFITLDKDGRIYWGKNGDAVPAIKIFLKEEREITPYSVFLDKGTTTDGTKEVSGILGKDCTTLRPKPVKLIETLIQLSSQDNSIILDFFAGTGTTGHSTIKLNKKTNGKRQFILCTNNESKIMTNYCYPRIKKIIKGYGEEKGLGNSIKYYKTAFIGKNNILKADDADKIELAHNAGGMLAIAENTFDKVEQNNYWQIFENQKQFTAVYFREEFSKFDNFVEKVGKLKKPTVVYIFSWEKEFEFNEFEDDKNIKVKTIPQPILEIYKQIYNLI